MPEPGEAAVVDESKLDAAIDKAVAESGIADAPEDPKPPANEPGPNDKPAGNGNGELTEDEKKALADYRVGKWVPKYRFDEVSGRAKAYASFGTPEEIQKIIDGVKQKEAPPAASAKELTQEDKDMQKYIKDLYPQIGDISELNVKEIKDLAKQMQEFLKLRQEESARENERFGASAEKYVVDLAKAKGIDAENAKLMNYVLSLVESELKEDETINSQFYSERNLELLKPIFDKVYETIFSGVQRKAAADLLSDKKKEEKLPKRVVVGGVPNKDKQEKPKTFEEANEAAANALFSS